MLRLKGMNSVKIGEFLMKFFTGFLYKILLATTILIPIGQVLCLIYVL
jgi:hypothetical protein